MSASRTTSLLVLVLLFEAVLVVALRRMGWYGTGDAIQLSLCLIVTLLPMLGAMLLILRRGLKLSIRSLLAATALIALFLVLSLLPLTRHRAARQVSMQLLAANAKINKGFDRDDFYTHIFYTHIDLEPPPKLSPPDPDAVPVWLTSFVKTTDAIPTDDSVRSIGLNSDRQCRILAENWERLPLLQSVSITRGVSHEGFRLLQNTLPRFKHLDSVFTNDVSVPLNWYAFLTNVRSLWVWGEGAYSGKRFDEAHLQDIASLSNLEMLFVLGYAFDDDDARTLAVSLSIKRVILRGTAVTQDGESELANPDRLVYRN